MGSVKPAVRLDRPAEPSADDAPAACGDDCDAGVRVSLEAGMTLYSLAREYGVPLRSLMRVNGITDPKAIRAGTEITIPTSDGAPGQAPGPPRDSRPGRNAATASDPRPGVAKGNIAWPLDGRITGGFGLRGRHHHHDGIDIDGSQGEVVRAVAAGIVVRSGNEGKYGKTVLIDHGDGVTTLYAHASRLLVEEGDRVDAGESIAEVGATGNAHGTHLHFEVRKNGHPVDPLPYLGPDMLGAAPH
jgi:murein DD-endopeptidase MepM/ murein hydrolase activator NlpD